MALLFLSKTQAAPADLASLQQALAAPALASLKAVSSGSLQDLSWSLYQAADLTVPSLKALCDSHLADTGFDCLVLDEKSAPDLNQPGCLVMDMDMSAVTIEGIDEIARALHVYEQVAAITHAAMHGNLDFASSLRKRVSLLAGGDASVIEKVKTIMHETPGLEVLMQTLTSHGWKKGIASGGFVQLICVLEQKYGLDMVRANCLDIDDSNHFTGKVRGTIVDADGKKAALEELCADNAIPLQQSIVIGDGANDLKMIKIAGLGLAYHAKPKVQQEAPYKLNYSDLKAVAALLLAVKDVLHPAA